MSQLAPKQQTATLFVGAHISTDARDQLRALGREEDRSISAILRRALKSSRRRSWSCEASDERGLQGPLSDMQPRRILST